MNYEYESEEQLIAAAQGAFGPEVQADALRYVDFDDGDDYEDGLDQRLDQLEERLDDGEEWDEEPEPTVGDEQWQLEFNRQIKRLENRIGRELATSEVHAIKEDTLPFDHIPDLAEKHGDQLGARLHNTEDRQQLMAEYVDEGAYFSNMEAEQQPGAEEAPEPAEEAAA